MIDVILETGEDRRQVVRKAVDALGDIFIERCKSAETILIKPNLVHHELQLASTHVDAVRAVIDSIRVHSNSLIYIGDASYRGTKAAFRNFGYEQLEKEYDKVSLIDLNDAKVVDGYSIKRDGSHNAIRRSKIALDADFKISIAPMKMDSSAGVSLTVKNWTIGTWIVPPRISITGRVWAHWPWLEEEGENAYHASIAELYNQAPCDVGIIDGVIAMQGNGPVQGSALEMGVVLAGMDAVAVDAVGATLMGVEPQNIGYLAMCAEKNLGTLDMGRINVPPMQVASLSRKFDEPNGFAEKLKSWQNK